MLRNCPFDKLRDTDRELVCDINHALAQSHLNLGDGGSLFVFDDGTVVFQCH